MILRRMSPLPPELERFAAEAVAAGRYRNVSDALAAGLRLLQARQAEAEVAAFGAALEAARAEAARDGSVTIDERAAKLDAIIAAETPSQTQS
jgi:putative addiction module CopG family antidote